MMRVRPATPAAVIRFPNDRGRVLPAEGAEVPSEGPDANYWHRRILHGDVVRCDAPGAAPLTPLITR
jgi:hypothetical protein